MTLHMYCYRVTHPGLPDGGIWTYEDYEAAFEHATGLSLSDHIGDDDYCLEVGAEEATLTCFGWSS